MQDQITHGECGLLADRARAREIGARAHDRVRDQFLAPRQLTETMELVCEPA